MPLSLFSPIGTTRSKSSAILIPPTPGGRKGPAGHSKGRRFLDRSLVLMVAGVALVALSACEPTVPIFTTGTGPTVPSSTTGTEPTVPSSTTGTEPTVVSYTNGIDVSHYQGVIDWASVAKSGERFVFAKATEGGTYNDPNYATNKQGATANGLIFGAYHFARPGGSGSTAIKTDAIAEADHFANVAGIGRGALLPVLDLEATGGLGASDLKYWTRTYLDRIEFRLGVKAIIYSSPSFWENYLGNTTWFAANGYNFLWIAHYGVASPRVPANNWNGYGWTFWQWTGCGTVPGITGCVDRNYYQSTDLSSVLIP
ncbi:MAG: glycoside hydrolase family 25 protein [Acidimicrobiales bacterium]